MISKIALWIMMSVFIGYSLYLFVNQEGASIGKLYTQIYAPYFSFGILWIFFSLAISSRGSFMPENMTEIDMGKQRNISISIGVAVVVIPPNHHTLFDSPMLVGRRKKGIGKGALAMPGGKLEEMEDFFACGVREVREETGLEVRPILIDGHTYVFHTESWLRQGKHTVTAYMAASVVGGVLANPEPHKHEDWCWMPLDRLATICTPDDWLPIVALQKNRHKIWV